MNPYTPPESQNLEITKQRESIRELVMGWERLRLRYNIILLPFGLAAGIIWVYYSFPIIEGAIFGAVAFAIVANIAFLLGPAFELYSRALLMNGRKSSVLRNVSFWLGTAFSFMIIVGYAIMPLLGLLDNLAF